MIIYLNCANTETSTNYITGNTKFKIGDGTTAVGSLSFQEGQVIELSSITGTLSVKDYNEIIKSPCNKIKYSSRIYRFQSEASDSITYVSNNGSVGYYITITKSTRAITGGSSSALPITGGTLTGDLRLKDSTNYGCSLLFGDGSYAYIKEDTDDHLKVYGNKGVTLETSGSYSIKATGGSNPLESTNGFKKTDFDNTYVLLAGGGAKLLSELGGGGSGGTTLANGTTLYLHKITLSSSNGNIANFSFYSDRGSSYTGDLATFKTDFGAVNNLIITDGNVIVNNTLYCILDVTVDSGLNVINVTYYNGSTSTNLTSWTSINDKVAKMASLGGEGEVITLTSASGTLDQDTYDKIVSSPFNKIKYANKIYILQEENSTSYVYTSNYLASGSRITITKSTRAISTGSLGAITSHYTAYNYIGEKDKASNGATTNGNTYLKLYESGSKRSQFNIKGTGATTVTSDTSGNITINSTDTNTKVTSVDNHYTPTADSTSAIEKNASSTTEATWGTTSLVTGVNIQRDAKGHVTGMTLDSIKMPVKPEAGGASYDIIELTSSQTILTDEQYNTLTASSFNKIKFNNIVYNLYQETSSNFVYTANLLNNGERITVTKNTKAITKGSLSSLASISSYVKNNLDYNINNSTYALSAYQGKVLNDRLTAVENASGGSSTNGFYQYNAVLYNNPTVGSTYSYYDSKTVYPSGCSYFLGQMVIDTNGVIYRVTASTMCECVYIPATSALEAKLTALEARVAALESGGSELYTISGSTDGKYYNLTTSNDFRDYFYGGQLSSLTLSNSTNTNFDINCGNSGNGVVITYGTQQSGGSGSGYTTNYLNLGTDPIKITAINVEFSQSYMSSAEHYGINLDTRRAEIKGDVLAKLPKMFSKTSS